MASQDTGESRGLEQPGQGAGAAPSPDAMLGVWTSWVDAMWGQAGQGWASSAGPWWQVTTDDLAGIPRVVAGTAPVVH